MIRGRGNRQRGGEYVSGIRLLRQAQAEVQAGKRDPEVVPRAPPHPFTPRLDPPFRVR